MKPADKITIEILDSKDRVIRTFVGSPEEDKRRYSGSGSAEEGESFGPPPPRAPGRKAGTNRFAWDLRYPGATVFEGMILWSARAESCPLAPPADYRVRLTVDGKAETQTFAIKKDPRLSYV